MAFHPSELDQHSQQLPVAVRVYRIHRIPNRLITAYGDAETKRKALEGGAEALFTKPIDFGMLRGEIDTRVERAA